jgi:hypothetical protein
VVALALVVRVALALVMRVALAIVVRVALADSGEGGRDRHVAVLAVCRRMVLPGYPEHGLQCGRQHGTSSLPGS